ncbi:MAG: VCBS repeat-containing protein [Candidatus Omnitrophica bacterium]|nr:VCBS repeat-containing protein [Candidatus Omnitrophota bacterium]
MSSKKKIALGIVTGIVFISLYLPLHIHLFQTPPPNPVLAEPKPLPELSDARIAEIEALIDDHSNRSGSTVSFRGDVNSDGVKDWITFPPVEVSLSIPGAKSAVRMKKRGLLGWESFGYSGVTSVGLDDVNGDGFVDAWIADPADGALQVYYGKRRSFYWFRSTLLLGGLRQICFIDLDEDGDLDLVGKNLGSFYEKRIYWMESKVVE